MRKESTIPPCLLPSFLEESQELFCDPEVTCSLTQFKCSSGSQCVHRGKFCNGKKECRDGSDEITFDFFNHPPELGEACSNRRAPNKTCLLPAKFSQKSSVICHQRVTCKENQFQCSDTSKCIGRDQFCDGVSDCRDGSDEQVFQQHLKETGTSCFRRNSFKPACILPKKFNQKVSTLCDTEKQCDKDTYKCYDGSKCINKEKFCDGENDCSDGSDENIADFSSDRGDILCLNSKSTKPPCILFGRFSQDASSLCDENVECSEEEFKCSEGSTCIARDLFCNGEVDCPDGSDEIPYAGQDGSSCLNKGSHLASCLLPSKFSQDESVLCDHEAECLEDEYKCTDGSMCIKRERFCDGSTDCIDGSDEIPYKDDDVINGGVSCLNKASRKTACLLSGRFEQNIKAICDPDVKCSKEEYKCLDGSACIAKEDFCDGVVNCKDESDEIRYTREFHSEEDGVSCMRSMSLNPSCLLPARFSQNHSEICDTEAQCSIDEFKCSDGSSCVKKENFCDGSRDCKDGSDEIRYIAQLHELDVTPKPRSSILAASKTARILKGTSCFNKDSENPACLLASKFNQNSEYLCDFEIRCPKDEYKCYDGTQCIDKERFCDGEQDCSDGSDEIRFNVTLHGLAEGVSCFNRHFNMPECLLPRRFRQSEVLLCHPNVQCESTQFKCSDGLTCVDKDKFCDGIYHCRDGSDEIVYGLELFEEEDGVPCFNKNSLKGYCLLPSRFDQDENLLCDTVADCPNNLFKCSDGIRCVGKEHFCNGIEDCSDGSDEITYDAEFHSEEKGVSCFNRDHGQPSCLLPSTFTQDAELLCDFEITCPEAQFKCSNGLKCLHENDFCNGEVDCSDGSDEITYDPSIHTSKEGVSCFNSGFGVPPCLLPKKFGQSDILLCDPEKYCSENQFKCSDGLRCLDKAFFCDGEYHCRDGSDEVTFIEELHAGKGLPCLNKASYLPSCFLPNIFKQDGALLCDEFE